jgi:myo-inositol-1(or 4)-monophosphatase
VNDAEVVPGPAELEQICVQLASGAAAVVRRASGEIASVATKSTATDLVTDVDRTSERWLVAELAARRPHDGVLGEEDGARPGTTGVRWVLDPIDGTVNFVLGLPQYAVSVAAEVNGEVHAGAVANPATGESFHASRGGGAFLRTGAHSRRLAGPRDVPLDRAVVATGFAYDAEVRAQQMAVAAALITRIADIRRLGAAALDLCFLAAGRVDAYYEAGLHPWDYAAAGLIATEAGCMTSGLRGAAAGVQMYAAAGPRLAPELFGLLEAVGTDTAQSTTAQATTAQATTAPAATAAPGS